MMDSWGIDFEKALAATPGGLGRAQVEQGPSDGPDVVESMVDNESALMTTATDVGHSQAKEGPSHGPDVVESMAIKDDALMATKGGVGQSHAKQAPAHDTEDARRSRRRKPPHRFLGDPLLLPVSNDAPEKREFWPQSLLAMIS